MSGSAGVSSLGTGFSRPTPTGSHPRRPALPEGSDAPSAIITQLCGSAARGLAINPGRPSKCMRAMLQVQDLTVTYRTSAGTQIQAVAGVTFTIKPGEALGVLGESGCGKTSVALSLIRLIPASSGSVRGRILFKGMELQDLCERDLGKVRGAEISLIFQEPSIALNPVMRVGEQIVEVLRAHRRWGRRRCREEAESMLEQVRLPVSSGLFDAYPHELSGGQRQRVLIAQALVCHPSLVIADEPTTGLDTQTQAEILALLRDLKERSQTSFLFISHHPGVLAGLADRLLVMYAGKIVEEGTLQETYATPLHPYTQGLLRSLPAVPTDGGAARRTRLPALAGRPPDWSDHPRGCSFSPRCPERMTDCDDRDPKEIEYDARRVRCFKYGN